MSELIEFERAALERAVSELIQEYPKLKDKITKLGEAHERAISAISE